MSDRVLIVGSGIVGLCSAYYAAKAGLRPTLLEREAQTIANCSIGNAGMVVPSHFTPLAAPGMLQYGLQQAIRRGSPFGIHLSPQLLGWSAKFASACRPERANAAKPVLAKLNLLSAKEYDCLAEELGNFGLTHKGLVMLCKTAEALEEETALVREAPHFGLEAHRLSRADIAKLDPGIELDVRGGVYFPGDSHLSPGVLVTLLRRKLVEMGVEFRYSTAATGFEKEGRKIVGVRCGTETLSVDAVVLATGTWTGALVKDLGLSIPIVSGKGYSFDIAKPAQMPTVCSILVEGRVAVTPMIGGLRVAGTMELGAETTTVNSGRVQGIRRSLAEYYPGLAADANGGSEVWVGFRPCSPDGVPFLGRTLRYDNLVIAAGHSMMGLSLGPISGRLVADILLSRPLPIDLSLLSVDRYA